MKRPHPMHAAPAEGCPQPLQPSSVQAMELALLMGPPPLLLLQRGLQALRHPSR